MAWEIAGVAFLVAALGAGCAPRVAVTSSGRTITSTAGAATTLDGDVAELVRESDETDREFRSRGLVVEDDPGLQAYLDSVASRVAAAEGPSAIACRFAVFRDAVQNAFALPNGSIYVSMGLLSSLESEAQLAYVLGHELAHIVRGHSIEQLRHFKSATVKAKLADVLLGFPLAPAIALVHAASVNGFSREKESEADAEGLRLVATAGYSAADAIRIFDLHDAAEELGGSEAYFFSDHPAALDRVEQAKQTLASGILSSDGFSGRERHRTATGPIARRTIDLCLQRQLYTKGLREAERQLAWRGEDPWLLYYAAEAHRLIAADPEGAAREAAARRRARADAALIESWRARVGVERAAAKEAYEKALAANPAFGSAHRGLGLLARDVADYATARTELRTYLRSGESIPDRRAIERILEEVSS